jgi:hypothetical protein
MGLLSDVADFGKDAIDDREKWADRFRKVGHFIERNAKGDRLERVAKFGRALGDFSSKFTDFFESNLGKRMVKAARSPILAAGQHVITGMKLTTGVGTRKTVSGSARARIGSAKRAARWVPHTPPTTGTVVRRARICPETAIR